MPTRSFRTSDSVQIVYDDLGPRDGRCLLLLHGLAANGAQFGADAEFFARQGLRVLVPDLRGHGRSGSPARIEAKGFTKERMAADMLAVLDHAGVEAVDWVGNSLGGILGLELAASHASRLRSFASFGTAHALSLPGLAAKAIPWGSKMLGQKMISSLGAVVTSRNVSAWPLIARMLRDFDPRVGQAVAENIRDYDLLASALAYEGLMLLIRGRRDRQVNLALRKSLPQLAHKPNFTLVEVRNAGHCANLDAPEEIRRILLTHLARAAQTRNDGAAKGSSPTSSSWRPDDRPGP